MVFPVPAVKSHFSQLLNRMHPILHGKTSVTNTVFMATKVHIYINYIPQLPVVCFLNEWSVSNCHLGFLHVHLSDFIQCVGENSVRVKQPSMVQFFFPLTSALLCSFWQNYTQKLHNTTNFLEEVTGDTQMTTTVKVTPRLHNLIPSHPQSPQQWQRCCYGGRPYWRSFLLYRRNNRLKIVLFIFSQGERKRRGCED